MAEGPKYEIGKRYPMPERKLIINPAHWVDDDRPADTRPIPPAYEKPVEPEK